MSFSVNEILQWTGGRIANADECSAFREKVCVSRPAPLKGSKSTELGYFFNPSYKDELPFASPGILITGEPFVAPLQASGLPLWKKSVVIACADPYVTMGLLSGKFAEKLSTAGHVPGVSVPKETKVHASAVVHPSAVLGAGVHVGPYCVIEEGAVLGEGTVLYPHCFIGPRVRLGSECVLFPNVSVYEFVEIGDRARIHAGAVIGADGFGFAPIRAPGSKTVVGHQKIYHLGRVVIGNDVEVGANTCIDRGTIGDTTLANNVKLDNLVQVAHNVRIDEGGVICGGTAMAGNSSLGKYAYVGGLTGVTNQVHIGDGAQVGALALVTKDVPPGGTAVGNPQRDYREHFKAHAILTKLLADRKSKKGP